MNEFLRNAMNQVHEGSLYAVLGILLAGVGGLIGVNRYHARRHARMLAELEAELEAEEERDRWKSTPEHRVLRLPATGEEIFTAEPLAVGRVYRVTVSGCYSFRYKWEGFKGNYFCRERRTGWADALYETDEHGNFTKRHSSGLRFGNGAALHRAHEVPHILESSDRGSHSYSFLLDGNGNRFSIARVPEGVQPSGVLRVDVVLLDESTPTLARRREEEAHRKAIEKIRGELGKIRVSSEVNRNWSDPDFVEKYVKAHGRSLLDARDRIQREFTALHARQPGLVEYMREHEGDLYKRLMGPLEGFLAAQREAVEPRPAVVEPEPAPRRRLTIEEWQQKYIVQRIGVAMSDKKIGVEEVLAGWEAMAQPLRQGGLEEDEVVGLIGSKADAVRDWLDQHDERKERRQGNGHVQTEQLG